MLKDVQILNPITLISILNLSGLPNAGNNYINKHSVSFGLSLTLGGFIDTHPSIFPVSVVLRNFLLAFFLGCLLNILANLAALSFPVDLPPDL